MIIENNEYTIIMVKIHLRNLLGIINSTNILEKYRLLV